MTVIAMAIAGFAWGFALDAAIARLAREPYETGDIEEDDLRLRQDDGPGLELHSETGALAMPRALTTASAYRTIIVVALTALLFALVGDRYEGSAWQLGVVAAYASVLIICASTDVLAYRVPNVITYPAIIAALVIGMVAPGADRTDVALGALLAGGLFFVPAILSGGAMGMGDVKLALFAGLALGHPMLAFQMLLITALAGGIGAALFLVSRLRGRGDPIPYAPFIAAATMAVMLLYGIAFRDF